MSAIAFALRALRYPLRRLCVDRGPAGTPARPRLGRWPSDRPRAEFHLPRCEPSIPQQKPPSRADSTARTRPPGAESDDRPSPSRCSRRWRRRRSVARIVGRRLLPRGVRASSRAPFGLIEGPFERLPDRSTKRLDSARQRRYGGLQQEDRLIFDTKLIEVLTRFLILLRILFIACCHDGYLVARLQMNHLPYMRIVDENVLWRFQR